jgi:hypothetical protein
MFTILTVSRAGETLGAKPEEFDFDNRVCAAFIIVMLLNCRPYSLWKTYFSPGSMRPLDDGDCIIGERHTMFTTRPSCVQPGRGQRVVRAGDPDKAGGLVAKLTKSLYLCPDLIKARFNGPH